MWKFSFSCTIILGVTTSCLLTSSSVTSPSNLLLTFCYPKHNEDKGREWPWGSQTPLNQLKLCLTTQRQTRIIDASNEWGHNRMVNIGTLSVEGHLSGVSHKRATGVETKWRTNWCEEKKWKLTDRRAKLIQHTHTHTQTHTHTHIYIYI